MTCSNSVIPVVMGAPRKDYEKIAPPHSFIHVNDFPGPSALAKLEFFWFMNHSLLSFFFLSHHSILPHSLNSQLHSHASEKKAIQFVLVTQSFEINGNLKIQYYRCPTGSREWTSFTFLCEKRSVNGGPKIALFAQATW